MKQLTFALLLLLFSSCGGGRRAAMLALLDEADSLNRNYLPVTGDSLLKDAASWFDSHGSANERMRAHYLLGCAYRDKGEAPAALQSYNDAIDCADTTSADCDYRLLSRVHGQMGAVFIKEYLPTPALKEFEKACHFCHLIKDTLAYLLFEEAKIQSYYMLNERDSVISLTSKVRNEYIRLGQKQYAAGVVSELLFIYIREKKLSELKPYIDFYSSLSNVDHNEAQWSNYNYVQGMYYLGINRLDSAEYYLRRQHETSGGVINKQLLAYSGLLELFQEKKIPDSLYKYSKLYNAANDSSNLYRESAGILRMQHQYDYSRHQLLAEKYSNKEIQTRYQLYISIILLLMVLLTAIYLYRKNKIKYLDKIREINEKYYSELSAFRKATSELENLRAKNYSIQQLLVEKEEEIQSIEKRLLGFQQSENAHIDRSLYGIMCESQIIIHLHKLAAKGKCADSNELMEFRQVLNQQQPSLMEQLLQYDYNLNLRETNIVLLIKAQFLSSEISVLLNISPQVLSNTKSKILLRLFNIKGKANELNDIITQL